jgi:hypothetical protein
MGLFGNSAIWVRRVKSRFLERQRGLEMGLNGFVRRKTQEFKTSGSEILELNGFSIAGSRFDVE